MRFTTLFFVFFFTTISFAQVIKGKVFDSKNQPLPGANIYFDGTTIATISDANGDFILKYSSKINSLLAISFIGFQTQFIKDIEADKELKIILIETVNSLSEVIIKKDRFSRKEKLKLFREQFLGTSNTAKKAVIVNEEDIYFEYDEVNNTIKAYSDNPLIINNVSLGYKINYELINFEVKFYKLSIDSSDAVRSY